MSVAERETAPRPPHRQARGTQRHDSIVRAAAELILSDGPAAVTHRSVAAHAGVPLASTTYYFSGLDELIVAAGERIVDGWTEHARAVAVSAAESGGPALSSKVDPVLARAAVFVNAVLPPGGTTELLGFYEQLVRAGRGSALTRAYGKGRAQLDDVLDKLLEQLGGGPSTALLVAVVDGAAVSALSEGHDVRMHARDLVAEVLRSHDEQPPA